MNIKAGLASVAALVFLGLPASAQGGNYSPDQLDQLLQPIALYPDPLLAQLLPAAQNPEQIQVAEQFVQYNPKGPGIDTQPWDASVRAIAHYPDVLAKMAQDPNWTGAIGQAFATQSQDVTESIQRLRRQAYSYGNLQNSAQMTITDDQNYLSIAPANPQYIYVPVYDPGEVYYSSYYNRPALYFSAGYSCGPWLNIGLDWIGGSCFNYPRGCYWGPGGNICNDRGYQGDNFSATYIHNTYNIDNRAAYRGNGGSWQGNRGQANFNGRGNGGRNDFSAANTGTRYQGNGYNRGNGKDFSTNSTGRYQGGGNRINGQNLSTNGFNRGNGQNFSTNNTGSSRTSGQGNLTTSNGRYKPSTSSTQKSFSPSATASAPTQSSRYNSTQPAVSRPGGSAYSQPAATQNPHQPAQQHYTRSYSQPGQQNFSRPRYSQPAQQNFSRPSFSQPTQQNFFRPRYSQPAQQNFSRPSYSQPAQQNFSRPSYSQPAQQNFSRPSYSQPAQQNFSRPSYSQPARQNFSQPSMSQPTRSFSAPAQNRSTAPQRSNRDRR